VLPNFSYYHPALSSCGTDDALLFLQQRILFPQGWRMALQTTVEDQVIGVLHRTHTCDLEEITRQCTNLTWNQVFLAVDRLSRSGELRLVPRGRGLYTVIFRQPLDGRPYPPSLPS